MIKLIFLPDVTKLIDDEASAEGDESNSKVLDGLHEA